MQDYKPRVILYLQDSLLFSRIFRQAKTASNSRRIIVPRKKAAAVIQISLKRYESIDSKAGPILSLEETQKRKEIRTWLNCNTQKANSESTRYLTKCIRTDIESKSSADIFLLHNL